MLPLFSVVLPFYKQGDHLETALQEFKDALTASGDSFEIIVVINGVAEQTEAVQKRVRGENPRIMEVVMRDGGWGRAVKAGIAEASGAYVCYTNSARTEAAELTRILAYAKVRADAVVKATRIERESKTRKWVSIAYNLENRLVLKTPIWDVNATPKVIPKKILDAITLHDDADVIDAELMYKCFMSDVPIIEIPIRSRMRRGGKSTTRLIGSGWRMFAGLLAVKKM